MPSLRTRQLSPPNGSLRRPGPSAAERPGLLNDLISASLVLLEDWEALPREAQQEIERTADPPMLLARLVEHGLLTEYQAARIDAGKTFGLILGNYRVLDRIGAGGMGVVFKAEHVEMRRLVAIKVLPLSEGQDPRLLQRFLAEMRAVARLHHPNIVGAIDAGKAQDADPDAPVLRYFVMEYVPGQDLEEYVRGNGPLVPARACDLAHQVASALAEAHKYDLVHRDIKPSNILLTPEDQAKLLDFGLAHHRQLGHRLTEPGTVLGTLDFMAPEQAQDASTVDGRADVYGLGATLFWCLTGETPFPSEGNIAQDLVRRLSLPPPLLRAVRPDAPEELEAVVARMMAVKPEDRYATPQAVMRALLPFLKLEARDQGVAAGPAAAEVRLPMPGGEAAARQHQVLIVDDEAGIRGLCRLVLQAEGVGCDEAVNGALALEAVAKKPYDLVLLDINMPEVNGVEVLRRLREEPPCPNLKVIMLSGRYSSDEMAQMLLAGADDYLTKPFSVVQLLGRIKSVLRLKDAQDRSELLNRHLLAVNAQLEHNLNARDSDLVHARNGLVLALAKLVAHRDIETGSHLVRMQRYCRALAEEAARAPTFAGQIDRHFIEMLECCAPLHDIGKVGLPDHILMKPGKLTPDERILMQAHTVMGADTLQEVAEQYGFALGFLQMAIDITRHHHERFDGSGYPDRLVGSAIPLAARLVAIGDVYDALRSRRVYKPALSHTAALQLMTEASPGHFDPALVAVFQRCAGSFERIFREVTD